MNSDSYVFARLDDVRYAVPTAYVLKILSDPSSIAVPDAPEGICGVVYDEGIIMPVRCFNLKRREPSELVVLCIGQSGYMAYAADSVETMGTISMTDLENAEELGDTGILLLDRKGI
jgi:Chemotaxis signal transduction protein